MDARDVENNGRRDVFGKPTPPNTVNADAFEASTPDVVGVCAAHVNSTLLPITRILLFRVLY